MMYITYEYTYVCTYKQSASGHFFALLTQYILAIYSHSTNSLSFLLIFLADSNLRSFHIATAV